MVSLASYKTSYKTNIIFSQMIMDFWTSNAIPCCHDQLGSVAGSGKPLRHQNGADPFGQQGYQQSMVTSIG